MYERAARGALADAVEPPLAPDMGLGLKIEGVKFML